MDPTLRKVYTNEGAEAVEKFIKLDEVWYGGLVKTLIKVWFKRLLKWYFFVGRGDRAKR